MQDPWLYHAFILITAAVIVVPLAKRSGLGSVLGYLLAGIVIGPYGLQFITDADAILHFSEFGIIMMLFLIGLELQPKILWRLRRPILGLGGLQVLLTAGAIACIGVAVGQHWTASVVIGLGIALSSTAVALQLLNEKGLMQSHTGQSSFSVLLFQDIAVIPILAMVPILASFSSETATTAIETVVEGVLSATTGEERDAIWQSWMEPLKNFSLIAVILAIGHFGLRPALRMLAQTRIQELFTAVSLFIVIGVTLLTSSMGLSPALGAFLAGVMLAESEYRHEIEHEIKPFKAILLALFFMSVGMSIQFTTILAEPLLIIGLLIGLIAVKFTVLAGIAKWYKMNKTQMLLFATFLAQGGEFAFVIFKLATDQHVLSTQVSELMTVVCALSMALTPVLILLLDKFVLSRMTATYSPLKTPEALPPQQQSVILLGFGRFGQVVGRLLHAQGYPLTILDHDPDQIDMTRKFGFKVFYGDAADLTLLETAGLATARMVVIAIDERETTLKIIRELKQKYPAIPVLVRARDRQHVYELNKAGADYIMREMFQSALSMGQEALVRLGMTLAEAQDRSQKFAAHDEQTLAQSFQFYENEKDLISFAIRSREELEQMFAADAATHRASSQKTGL